MRKIILFLVIFCFLFVGFSWAEPKTEVLVLGTIHGNHFENPNYSPAHLLGIFEKFSPQVAILEVLPEYLNNPHNVAPPEMGKIIMPYCKEHNIKIYGMDYFPYDVNNLQKDKEEQFKKLSEEVDKDPVKKKKIEDFENSSYGKKYGNEYMAAFNSNKKDAFYFNSKEIKEFLREYYSKIYQILGDTAYSDYWETRNLKMSELTLKAIKENPNKRIIVCTGSDHVYWIEDYLKKIENIKVIDLNDIGIVVPVKTLPVQTQKFIDVLNSNKLFWYLESPKANNFPDNLDLSVVENDIQKILSKKDLTCKENFILGRYYYIKRNYLKALEYYKKAVQNTKDSKLSMGKSELNLTFLTYVRMANMYDLLNKRDKAIELYKKVLNSNDETPNLKKLCEKYIEKPFTR